MLLNPELWKKAEAFDMDVPAGDYCFSIRLQEENAWTAAFTVKAITEYKKFMYLIAVSDEMLAPSEIVDVVWHQHLIFTKSYEDFCQLLGKKISHIPSTHDKAKEMQFKNAFKQTLRSYRENFGQFPAEIWIQQNTSENGVLKPFPVSKKYLSFAAIVITLILAYPVSQILHPQLMQIENPSFILSYLFIIIILAVITFLMNRIYYRNLLLKLQHHPSLGEMSSDELVYLQRKRISDVIIYRIDRLLYENKITISQSKNLSITKDAKTNNRYDNAIIDAIKYESAGRPDKIIRYLSWSSTFRSIISSAEKVIGLVENSKKSIFMHIITILSWMSVFLIGISRLIIGIEREKPVVFLIIILILAIIFTLIFLSKIGNYSIRKGIINVYRRKMIYEKQEQGDSNWEYFLTGTAAMSPMLIPFMYNNYQNENTRNSDSSSSSCGSGSSDGSSCGGSGCGGCGGGGD